MTKSTLWLRLVLHHELCRNINCLSQHVNLDIIRKSLENAIRVGHSCENSLMLADTVYYDISDRNVYIVMAQLCVTSGRI